MHWSQKNILEGDVVRYSFEYLAKSRKVIEDLLILCSKRDGPLSVGACRLEGIVLSIQPCEKDSLKTIM